MTIREKALELAERAGVVYRADYERDDRRIERLCVIVEELAKLVAACAPELKEAP